MDTKKTTHTPGHKDCTAEKGCREFRAIGPTVPAHTRGPWEQEIAPYRRFRSKGTNIVNLDGTVGKLVGFSVEDRRLIAAAPEILSALKYAEEWLREDAWMKGDPEYFAKMMKKASAVAREAIAKAEGK